MATATKARATRKSKAPKSKMPTAFGLSSIYGDSTKEAMIERLEEILTKAKQWQHSIDLLFEGHITPRELWDTTNPDKHSEDITCVEELECWIHDIEYRNTLV